MGGGGVRSGELGIGFELLTAPSLYYKDFRGENRKVHIHTCKPDIARSRNYLISVLYTFDEDPVT